MPPRAGEQGQFLLYFKTKTDLVVAAYEEHWQCKLSEYDRIFSKKHPPLRRLELWCEYLRGSQQKRRKEYGHACGCPYTSLGGELANRDPKVRRKAQDLIERHIVFLSEAIAEAQRDGAAAPGDPVLKAQLVHSLIIGLSLRARIYDDLKILRHCEEAVLALIGARP